MTDRHGEAAKIRQNWAFWVRTEDIISTNLWRTFPVINVDKVKNIPCDYPGAMGVPITFLDKWNQGQFELLDCINPKIGSKELYKRIIIRNLHPKLPEWIDLNEWLRRTDSKFEVVFLKDPDEK